MTAHLTVFQRDLARRLRAGGMSLRDIAKEVGCSHSGIDVVLRGGQAREARAEAWMSIRTREHRWVLPLSAGLSGGSGSGGSCR